MRILNRSRTLGKLNFAVCIFVLLSGCTAAAPRTIVLSRGPENADALLAAHQPEAGRNVTPFLLEESKYSSRHLTWVRDREQPHIHATHDLVVILLRGQGTLWLRDREIPMREGDIAAVPAGVPHYFVNTGDRPAAAFAVFAPPSDGSDIVPVK